MDQTKLETAIWHLQEFYSTVDNILYYSYTNESLQQKLDKIQESIDLLQDYVSLYE